MIRINFIESETLARLPEQFFARLTDKIQEVEEEGHDVINLGRGNPDTETPPHIVEALKQAAEDPVNHRYAPFRGFSYLKEAIAEFYRREYDVDLDPETEVTVLFGSKAGLIELGMCLLDPGDTALLPNPGYPDYDAGVALANAKKETFELSPESGFLPDYESIPEDLLQRAKMMMLNYPNNPTAATATHAFFDETVDVAKQHHFCVVHDFAYGALGFDGERPVSFLQSKGAKEVGVETYTLSKTYNMAGWRIAFALGNASVIEHINKLQDQLYASIFGAIQSAAADALLGDQSVVKDLSDMYERRRNIFINRLIDAGGK